MLTFSIKVFYKGQSTIRRIKQQLLSCYALSFDGADLPITKLVKKIKDIEHYSIYNLLQVIDEEERDVVVTLYRLAIFKHNTFAIGSQQRNKQTVIIILKFQRKQPLVEEVKVYFSWTYPNMPL